VDAFIITLLIVVVAATMRILASYLPNRDA
jgi:hypothetical protein